MKVSLKELKKAVAWIEANTNAESIGVAEINSRFYLKCFDREDSEVEIVLYDEETHLMAKVKKSERL